MSPYDKFRSFSVDRQILLVLTGVILVAGLISFSYFTLLRTKYDVLFSNVRSADAATIVAELEKKKVPYQLRDDGRTILVPSAQADRSRIDLMSSDLPLKGTVGFELFNKSDMGITEFAQKINYQRALQGELARTIMSMDSVDEARVHLALAEPTIFRDDQKPPKASVTILTRQGKHLSDATIRGIQRLIAAAVPDLEVANVVVLDGYGAIVSDPAPEAAGSVWTDQKHAVEETYEVRIRRALAEIYPVAELDIFVTAGITEGAALGPGLNERDYPLHVSISSNSAISPSQEQAIRSAVLQEIHADPNIGDAIAIASSSAGPVRSPAVPSPTAAKTAKTDALPSGRQPMGSVFDVRSSIFALLFFAVVCGAFLLRAGRSGYRRLNANQRQAYAKRLRILLDGAESNGIS